ncbi:hypothetical protein ABT160_24520 [Streptomyces sp. NPDC001941]|uniref:hypothetical protein n=1 Tax=Streptomyces sp. NPDC001941 TaxID=3154659 RepID=UPI003325356A
MNSAYDRARLVGPVVLALAENLALTRDEAVALATQLAQQGGAALPSAPEEPQWTAATGPLTDAQLVSVVHHLVAVHRPDSYRKMRAHFRTAGHGAGEDRLRAAWAQVNSTAR